MSVKNVVFYVCGFLYGLGLNYFNGSKLVILVKVFALHKKLY